jgi:cell division protein FtsQ
MSAPVIPLDVQAREIKPSRRWRGLVFVMLALLATATIWLVWFSSVFVVRDVRVIGVTGSPAAKVLASAAVPLGVPMAQVDAGGATARIRLLPWVDSVEVRRGWPSDVILAVAPRIAIATQLGTGRGVDSSGVAFDAPEPLAKNLLAIDADGVGLVSAVSVWQSLPAPLLAKVVGISASTRDDVELVLKSGAKVRWGSAEQGELKAQVLAALLQRRAGFYDVSAPELPTTQQEKAG